MARDDDDNRGSRASRIARKYRAAFKKKSKELAQRDTLLDEFVGEHEQLLEAHGTTQEKLKAFEAAKKTEVHRKEFDKQAKKANVAPEHFDDLFRLSDLDLDADEPDPKDIAEAIREAVKKRPHMIAKAKKKGKTEEEAENEEEEETDEDDEETDIDDDLAGDEEEDDEPAAPAAKSTKKGEPKAETKLTKEVKLAKGEGAGRGGRAPIKPPSADEQIDADFAATGRTDAFRI